MVCGVTACDKCSDMAQHSKIKWKGGRLSGPQKDFKQRCSGALKHGPQSHQPLLRI
eukprot:m.6602 g.6602  ORF g.6602 m.6602 type:complete len:56 (+) comp5176_c0_seq1:1242-1409(+)